MVDSLQQVELFEAFGADDLRRVAEIAKPRMLFPTEYLFRLGDDANEFFVVVGGAVDLCFPMPVRGEVKDVAIESIHQGGALGWSALVKPYRFTLSARATEVSDVIGLPRRQLFELFGGEPRIGYTFFTRISELIGIRLHTFEALWARELQRLAECPAAQH
jgi:CRP-like cAMP-binding protein